MRYLVLALAIALGGCATISPTYIDQSLSTPAQGTSELTVQRGRMTGANNKPVYIFLDGRKVAAIGGGQAITLNVADGRHLVGVAMPMAFRFAEKPDREIAVDVDPHSRPILKASSVAIGYGGFKIERIN